MDDLGIAPGQELTWAEAKQRIAEKMTPEAFERPLLKLRASAGRHAPCLPMLFAFGLGLALGSAPALAAPKAPAHAVRHQHQAKAKAAIKPTLPEDPYALISIDLLRSDFASKKPSRVAKNVERASKALEDEKWNRAIAIAGSLQHDSLFSDFGYMIAAQAYRAKASEALEKKNAASGRALARKALDLLFKIPKESPYSAFNRDLGQELSKTELVIADSYVLRKSWSSAEKYYERGFERLGTRTGPLGMVPPEELGGYAEACSHVKSTLCPAWIQRFVQIEIKGSDELKAISKYLPDEGEKAQPPHFTGSRATVRYRAPDFDQQALDSALELYDGGKYDQAISAFEKFLDEFPKSVHRHRVRYWLAQALTHEQEHEKAEKVYQDLVKDTPLSYYGLVASIASNTPIDPFIDATLPKGAREDKFLYPAEIFHLHRAEKLIAAGVKDLAAVELKEIRARDSLSSPFLLWLATLDAEAGAHVASFNLLGELIQRDYEGVMSSYGLRLIFPSEYLDLIKKYAQQNALDPILVLSLIKQESAFDATAMSGAGASGLMQLMPATAMDVESDIKRADLVTAEANLRVGTKYLSKLLQRFNGNIAFALAGYNAGPNAVDRWIRNGKAKDGMLEFIENIPYKETREYVAGIVRNYYWYSKRLTGEAPKSLSYFWNMYGPPEQPHEIPLTPNNQGTTPVSDEARAGS